MSPIANPIGRRAALAGLAAASLPVARVHASGPRPPNGLLVGGTGAALGTVRRLVAAFRAENPGVEAEVSSSLGSNGGMRAVIAGAIDIATTARPLKAEEAAAGAKAFALGRSPYVFVTSRPEPPTRLSSDDIVEIYALRRRTWSDGMPLRLILRPRNDGETDFLIERFPRLRPVLEATHARQIAPVAQTDQLNLDLAETLQGSFASATLAAVVSEERRLKPLAIDNALPSVSTLASGEYPHFRPLNLVASATTSEAGQAFVAFAGSTKGRAILAECAVLASA